MLLLTGVTAGAESAGFSGENRYITASAAPVSNKYTQIQWGGDIQRDGCGIPLAYGNKVLLPAEDSLIVLNETDGAVADSMELPGECSTEYSGALIGSRLLQPTLNGLCLIDADDLKLKASRTFDGSISSDCAIIDGMGYTSVQLDDGYEFVCVDLGSETLDTLWSMELDEKPSSPAVQGDNIIIAAGSSIFTHDYKSGSSTEIPVGKEITGAPFASQYAVFFSTADGNAGKLRLNTDGTLEEDTLQFCKIGEQPSSPVSWNGRLYTATKDGFYILDNLNMEITYIITDIRGGCTPQVHYGSGPYIYTVAPREDRWAIYCILDMDDSGEPTYSILAQMDNFKGGAFCASDKGSLYFRDGIGRMYSLTAVPFNIWNLIIRLVVLLALLVLVFIWIKKIAKRRENLRPKY